MWICKINTICKIMKIYIVLQISCITNKNPLNIFELYSRSSVTYFLFTFSHVHIFTWPHKSRFSGSAYCGTQRMQKIIYLIFPSGEYVIIFSLRYSLWSSHPTDYFYQLILSKITHESRNEVGGWVFIPVSTYLAHERRKTTRWERHWLAKTC